MISQENTEMHKEETNGSIPPECGKLIAIIQTLDEKSQEIHLTFNKLPIQNITNNSTYKTANGETSEIDNEANKITDSINHEDCGQQQQNIFPLPTVNENIANSGNEKFFDSDGDTIINNMDINNTENEFEYRAEEFTENQGAAENTEDGGYYYAQREERMREIAECMNLTKEFRRDHGHQVYTRHLVNEKIFFNATNIEIRKYRASNCLRPDEEFTMKNGLLDNDFEFKKKCCEKKWEDINFDFGELEVRNLSIEDSMALFREMENMRKKFLEIEINMCYFEIQTEDFTRKIEDLGVMVDELGYIISDNEDFARERTELKHHFIQKNVFLNRLKMSGMVLIPHYELKLEEAIQNLQTCEDQFSQFDSEKEQLIQFFKSLEKN